jgi:hypothetical protein
LPSSGVVPSRLRFHFQVKAHFLVEIAVEFPAAKQHSKPP